MTTNAFKRESELQKFENSYVLGTIFKPNGEMLPISNKKKKKWNFNNPVIKTFFGVLFLCGNLFAQVLQNPSELVRLDLTGHGYTPTSTVIISNPNCFVQTPNGPFYQQTRRLTRCNPDISKQIAVKPRFADDIQIATHHVNFPGSGYGVARLTVPRYKFITQIFTTNNGVETLIQTYEKDYIVPRTGNILSGFVYHPLKKADLEAHDWLQYTNTGNHDVRIVVVLQENYAANTFQNTWRTIATFNTCKSEVRNQNGAPGFEILNTTFNNTTWPQHFQNCVSNIRIQTQNSCNNGFNLLVAEVNQNYQRTMVRDASRWFSNIKNREVNLQLFTQGIGEFSNNTFESQPFLMTGGQIITPNPGQAAGDRYFMIVVGTLEPNWSTSVKLVKMLNCKADSLNPGEVEIYDEDQIKEEFPEMLEAFNAYRKDYLKVFPNPSQNATYIQLETSLFHGAVQKVFALDPMGNRYEMEYHLEAEMGEIAQYQIHLQPLRRGVYTLIVVYENGHTATEKFIH